MQGAGDIDYILILSETLAQVGIDGHKEPSNHVTCEKASSEMLHQALKGLSEEMTSVGLSLRRWKKLKCRAGQGHGLMEEGLCMVT